MTAALAVALLLVAPPSSVVGARVTARPAQGDLAAAVAQALREREEARWIAWSVPIAPAQQMCCWDGGGAGEGSCCRGCRLESGGGFSRRGDAVARLEADGVGVVYLRAEAGRITRVRMFSADCPVEVGGRELMWLTDVSPADSLRVLAAQMERAGEGERRRVWDGALAAIAFHQDPGSDRLLIRLARQDPDSGVRGQALFWLAQKAGEKAAAAITRAIEDDPDADVKEKAVFALSQLPKHEGIPRLIELARTHRSRDVRKKAMFWLGQSGDPRALDFIESVLTR